MENEYLQLGALAVILLFAIKEFFTYLKGKSRNESNGSSFHTDLARELGGINESLKAIPKLEKRVGELADHVGVQNGRIGKIENKLKDLDK